LAFCTDAFALSADAFAFSADAIAFFISSSNCIFSLTKPSLFIIS